MLLIGIRSAFPRSYQGLTVVELMISMVISLVILGAAVSMFVSTSRAKKNIEQLGLQIENGQYAAAQLTDDLQNAGYMGQLNVGLVSRYTMASPQLGDPPDPCSTDINDLTTAWVLPVQGYDGRSDALTCINDVKGGTDILVIRRSSTCAAGESSCGGDVLSGAPFWQVSHCQTEIKADTRYVLSTQATALNLRAKNCATRASRRQFFVRIYYIANNDEPGDSIPTLKRAELNVQGGALGFQTYSVAQGIENLQISYGLDRAPGALTEFELRDGTPDQVTADPNLFNNCDATPNMCSVNWFDVVYAEFWLLARGSKPTVDFIDKKTYNVGIDLNGQVQSFGPFNDRYRRQVVNQRVRLPNSSGLREIQK